MSSTASSTPLLIKPRNEAIDHARGLGILLVVFGHEWDGIYRGVHGAIRDGLFYPVFNGVYSFHMTLFFFLAGLFLDRSVSRPGETVLKDRAARLLYPYVIWTLIQGGLKLRLHSDPKIQSLGQLLYGLVVRPIDQFWFLYCLMILSAVYFVLRRMRLTPWIIFGVAVAGYVALRVFKIPDHVKGTVAGDLFVSVFQSGMYFPALAAGAAVGARGLNRLFTMSVPVAAAMAMAFTGGLLLVVAQSPHADMRFDPLTGFLGTVAVLAIARLTVALKLPLLARIGLVSMEIYMVQVIVGAILRSALVKAHVTNWPVHLVIEVIGGVVAGLFVPAILIRFPIRSKKLPETIASTAS